MAHYLTLIRRNRSPADTLDIHNRSAWVPTMTCYTPFHESVIELVPKLRAYARALTRDKADADDLVQETLTKALRYHDRFAAGTQLKAWLFTIMRNTHYTAVKKSTRERPGSLDCVSDTVVVQPVHDTVIAYNETLAAIDRLPTRYREMLILVVMMEESYESAAVLLNCAVGTVKSRVNRARNMVLAQLTAASEIPQSASKSTTTNPARPS